MLRREHQRQAANQVSVGNSVTSLRLLANLDWSLFFERTSVVEAVLRNDPAGVYARQDFPTKDRYRRTVERIARRCDCNEIEVANRALALARRGQAPEDGGRKTADVSMPGTEPAVSLPPTVEPRNHVGYYLVDAGRTELYREVRYRPRLVHRLLDTILAHPNLVYFGSLTAMTGLLLFVVLLFAATRPGATTPLLLLTALAVLLPVSDLAVGLVHQLLTLVLPPRVLPKLDFKEGIPPDCLTFVVMPTMLLRTESAASLADRLEVHYLSNPDPQLRFALLTDFADAPTEHQPEDDDYLRLALERIKALNERYAAGGPDRFFLCHRRRVWNPAQGCWMGWERKRGKLSEFNRLLRGAKDTSYTVVSGDLGRLPPVRFVITLDADTQLPRETARRLVATLAHPLNRPRFDPRQGRVVAGYGVLQPRVGMSLRAANKSWFARIYTGTAGLDELRTMERTFSSSPAR